MADTRTGRCPTCRRDFEGCTCTSEQREPGLYEMTAVEYHADRASLSSSGARRILDCPALFRHEQDNPQPPKKTFDLGHAAHRLVLGTGPELVRIDADEWRTTAVKAEVAETRARGAVPLKPGEWQQVHDMAAALHRHPVAGRLFQAGTGTAESAGFWRDDRTGVMRRVLWDWRPDPGPGRTILPDYKTCRSAAPDALSKAMWEYGYHQQADWYRAGAQALDLADKDAEFVFVCQEKTPPYVVTVIQPDALAMRLGAARNRAALDTYAECVATGHWPGYTDEIAYLPLPPWAEKNDAEEYL
ncbi:PD-(D/E)XK nuclease-like domain-containing protein [Streptomyces sp. SCSIO ZS0520]|uniref:PD-(D/E)XK nuclease-like domain-containing protein n=1 Tax=Streptomyces sp. SCSIO ZS0520 TaxID=2892996 RepID=UPI0021DA9AB7|nr:PD-(D/E)XK nuclease-like domain-containing protein [Streptomyces sp. SCSIO ZS0520]